MVKKQRLWAHYGEVKSILGIYTALFFAVPFCSLGLSALVNSKAIDEGVQNALQAAMLSGLIWYAIIMSIITVVFLILFFYFSDRVEFTDDAIVYYRSIILKKASHSYAFININECVFSDGLWKCEAGFKRGLKIFIYNKNNKILEYDLYYKLCLAFALTLSEQKIGIVDVDNNKTTLNDYFKMNFMNLSYEQQLKLLKYYCKCARSKYKTGEEILSGK